MKILTLLFVCGVFLFQDESFIQNELSIQTLSNCSHFFILKNETNLTQNKKNELKTYLTVGGEEVCRSLNSNYKVYVTTQLLGNKSIASFTTLGDTLQELKLANIKQQLILKQNGINVTEEKIRKLLKKTENLLNHMSEIDHPLTQGEVDVFLQDEDEEFLFFIINYFSFLRTAESGQPTSIRLWPIMIAARVKLFKKHTKKSFIFLVYLASMYGRDGGDSLIYRETILKDLRLNPDADKSLVPARFLYTPIW